MAILVACLLEIAAGTAVCVLLVSRGFGNAGMLWFALVYFDAGMRLIKARNG